MIFIVLAFVLVHEITHFCISERVTLSYIKWFKPLEIYDHANSCLLFFHQGPVEYGGLFLKSLIRTTASIPTYETNKQQKQVKRKSRRGRVDNSVCKISAAQTWTPELSFCRKISIIRSGEWETEWVNPWSSVVSHSYHLS